MTISLASHAEIEEIMSFIHIEWKNDHILARDKDFFAYEHVVADQVNFVIAKIDNTIFGVLGFIPTAIGEKTDVCTVIWKVSKASPNPMLGIELLQFLQTQKSIRTVISVGINEKTIGIYKYLDMHTNCMAQYVRINPDIQKFTIGKFATPINRPHIQDYPSNQDVVVQKIEDTKSLNAFNFDAYKEHIPFKNQAYFIKRYYKHPIYTYAVYGVYDQQILTALFVTRIQTRYDAKIIRIVDFQGAENSIPFFSSYLGELLKKEKYEYADFYCFGLNRAILKKSGFQLININQEALIAPNYFSPFLQKNIPIYFFADTRELSSLKIFKADGDQDRPS